MMDSLMCFTKESVIHRKANEKGEFKMAKERDIYETFTS